MASGSVITKNNMRTVLGVRIDDVSEVAAQEQARNFLRGDKINYIFTPNPEMLVEAQRDRYFLDTLNTGDLNLCDGFGISLFTGIPKIAGVDFAMTLCGLAVEAGKTVYLLGTGKPEVVQRAAIHLSVRYPNLKVVGTDSGYAITLAPSETGAQLRFDANAHEELLNRIIMTAPDVLLVAFGHNKQEKWIAEFAHQIPSLKVAMGVGGTLSFWAGIAKRAPRWMQRLGLEWLWRLICEPHRVGRILRATVIFPILYWRKRLTGNV